MLKSQYDMKMFSTLQHRFSIQSTVCTVNATAHARLYALCIVLYWKYCIIHSPYFHLTTMIPDQNEQVACLYRSQLQYSFGGRRVVGKGRVQYCRVKELVCFSNIGDRVLLRFDCQKNVQTILYCCLLNFGCVSQNQFRVYIKTNSGFGKNLDSAKTNPKFGPNFFQPVRIDCDTQQLKFLQT